MKTAQKELIAKTPGNRRKNYKLSYTKTKKLELLYCGRQYASAYALIRRKDGMYYSFRFSDHKTTPYYSSKTFDIYAPITSEVLRNIRENPRQSLMVSLHPIRLPHPAHHLLFQ